MSEEDLRREAVARFVKGERGKDICSQLNRSKRWLVKWVKRYRSGGEQWFKDRPKTPRRCPSRTDSAVEQLVVDARKRLEEQKYCQIGPLAVAYELRRLGVKPPPLRTIGRILHRRGLTRKRRRYVPKGKDYPTIKATKPHEIHQADLVGPRFISNDGRFYSINVMDVFTAKAAVNPRRRRRNADVVSALLDTWQRLAIPSYLQMDNQLPLRGSNRHPRSFGLVVRVCLHLGIQPVFIPLSEPWRNGCIERFQDVFDKLFFRAQRFESFQCLVEEAAVFEDFHNENHHYSTRQGRAPNELETIGQQPPWRLAESFELPKKLYIEPGQIHVIRFIRSDALLDIFGLKFTMPKQVIYEYVTATIDTGKSLLNVVHDGTIVHQQAFKLAKTPMDSLL